MLARRLLPGFGLASCFGWALAGAESGETFHFMREDLDEKPEFIRIPNRMGTDQESHPLTPSHRQGISH